MRTSDSKKQNDMKKISIGLPVYNGENHIRKNLDSILAQTLKDFELIISDNASTDSTPAICKEYAKKDKRIRYIKQEKNIGMKENFAFVLQEAKHNYFVWTGVDDIMLPEFLEKNFNILESNSNFVGSISKTKAFNNGNLNYEPIDSHFKKIFKKLYSFKKFEVKSTSGTFEERAILCLRKHMCNTLYSVFRTDELRKGFVYEKFHGSDWALCLNVLKYGNIHVIDEFLLHKFEGGEGSRGVIYLARVFNEGIGIIFPFYPFTSWFASNFGTKILMKNLDFFFILNLETMLSQIIDLSRLFLHRILKK